MSAYLKTIDLYKQEGYKIKTSLNPMHFSASREFIEAYSAYTPFSYVISSINNDMELRGGGGK